MAAILLMRAEAMLQKSEYLDSFETAIILRHVCRPRYRQSAFVRKRTEDGELVWSGFVEVFDLDGHDEARTCYAWRHVENDGEVKIFTILGNQLIDSAKKAIQAGIFVDKQRVYPRARLRRRRLAA